MAVLLGILLSSLRRMQLSKPLDLSVPFMLRNPMRASVPVYRIVEESVREVEQCSN